MRLNSFVYRQESSACRALDAVWTLHVRRDGFGPLPYLTLPDGCVDLIYRLKRDSAGKVDSAGLFLAGPTEQPGTHFPEAGEEFAGVRFSPGRGGAALALATSELAGAILNAASLTPLLAHLEKRLFACESSHASLGLLRSTAELWASQHCPNDRTQQVVKALRISGGRLSVEQAAQLAGVSARTLRREVRDAVGLSPKSLLRIFRFRQALQRLEHDKELSLRDFALQAGYADQAHMTREFKMLGGFTPGAPSEWIEKATE